jgi:hypothetical protein
MSDDDSEEEDLQILKSWTAAVEGEGIPNSLRNFVYDDENDTNKFKKSLALQFVTNKKLTATGERSQTERHFRKRYFGTSTD